MKKNKRNLQNNCHAKLDLASSTHAVYKKQQQASKILNQVQDDNMFILTRGFTPLVTPQGFCAGYRGGPHTISRTTTLRDDVVCGPRGFTLIELLVVVLIIGILAAVAVPQYQKSITKARIAEYEINLKALGTAARICQLQKGDYCNVDELDIEKPECKVLPGTRGSCYYAIGRVQDTPVAVLNGQYFPTDQGILAYPYDPSTPFPESGGIGTTICAPVTKSTCEKIGFTKQLGRSSYYVKP